MSTLREAGSPGHCLGVVQGGVGGWDIALALLHPLLHTSRSVLLPSVTGLSRRPSKCFFWCVAREIRHRITEPSRVAGPSVSGIGGKASLHQPSKLHYLKIYHTQLWTHSGGMQKMSCNSILHLPSQVVPCIHSMAPIQPTGGFEPRGVCSAALVVTNVDVIHAGSSSVEQSAGLTIRCKVA